MDRISKIVRSRNMAAVKSRGNKSTEQAFATLLRKNHITGWRRHNKKILGNPDFVFLKKKIVVFIDGCFWHGCRKHRGVPESNKKFWIRKLNQNIQRDREVNRALRARGWKVIRIWEHYLRGKKVEIPKKLLNRILKK